MKKSFILFVLLLMLFIGLKILETYIGDSKTETSYTSEYQDNYLSDDHVDK